MALSHTLAARRTAELNVDAPAKWPSPAIHPADTEEGCQEFRRPKPSCPAPQRPAHDRGRPQAPPTARSARRPWDLPPRLAVHPHRAPARRGRRHRPADGRRSRRPRVGRSDHATPPAEVDGRSLVDLLTSRRTRDVVTLLEHYRDGYATWAWSSTCRHSARQDW